MAEPTIQLGGGNWAGKSGNLLGYYEQNKKFYAEDFTFSRSTSGTRVNSSGLIETASVISTTEEVANGDFSTDTDWTKGSGWTISGGSANQDNSTPNSGDLTQSNVTTSGKKYKVTFDLVVTSGTISALVGGHNLFTTSGTKTFIKTATSSNLTFRNYSNFVGSIDNVSVKEVIENNIPRVDYLNNSNGSLILEPQRTNLIRYSEDYSQWSAISSVINKNAISPSGDLNATTITDNGSGGSSGNVRIQAPNFSITASTQYTFSAYVKANPNTQIKVTTRNDDALRGGTFNISTLTFTPEQGTEIGSVESIGNGYYRIITTWTSGSDTSVGIGIGFPNITRDGTNSFILWGAQVELGSYPTTIINTSGSSVTRNADACSITNVADRIGQTEGTLYGEVYFQQTGSTNGLFAISDGSFNNFLMVRFSPTHKLQVEGTGGVNIIESTERASGTYKIAIKYDLNGVELWVGGSKIIETSTQSTMTGIDDFMVGKSPYGNIVGCKVNQTQVYNTALTDAELATLTT